MSSALRIVALVLLSAGTLLVQHLARDRPAVSDPPLSDEQLDVIQCCLAAVELLDKDEAAMLAIGHLPIDDVHASEVEAEAFADFVHWVDLLEGISARPALSHAVLRAKVSLLRRLIARDLVVDPDFTVVKDMPLDDKLVLSVLRDVTALMLR